MLLLEAIWSRLADRGFVGSSIFGDDRNVEAWNRLADARYLPGQGGWEYNLWPPRVAQPATSKFDRQWEPHEISGLQASLIGRLARDGCLSCGPAPTAGARDEVLDALSDLQQKGLVGEAIDRPGVWVPLPAQLTAVSTPEGKHYAADDISGRLRRWLADRA